MSNSLLTSFLVFLLVSANDQERYVFRLVSLALFQTTLVSYEYVDYYEDGSFPLRDNGRGF